VNPALSAAPEAMSILEHGASLSAPPIALSSIQTLGVVCPVFREEEAIERFHDRLAAAIAPLGERYRLRIVYVVDPAEDETEAILQRLARPGSGVEVLVMSRRFGHQAALLAGIEHCDADAIVMLDSDQQHPPELIPELVARWERGADIVQTVREDSADTPLLKRLTSRWFYEFMLKVGSINLPVGAADYRLISARIAQLLRDEIRERNPFLRGLFSWVGFTVAYVPFVPAQRAGGASKYRLGQLLSFALNGVCSFSKVPLRFCIGAGIVLAVLSILFSIVQVILYIRGETIVPGWATLIGAVGLIGGVQLFFLGVIGEYLSIVFDEVKARPRYIVAHRYGSRGDAHE